MSEGLVVSDQNTAAMSYCLTAAGEWYKKTDEGWWRIFPEDILSVFDRESQGTGV